MPTRPPTPADAATFKAALWQQLLARLHDDLAAMLRAASEAHEAATHEEAKPENDKDTRGLVESYLAAGQAARATELQRELSVLKAVALAVPSVIQIQTVAVGALVTVRDDDSDVVTEALIVPVGAGMALVHQGRRVQVISSQAPLARAVLGKAVGDSVDVVIAGKSRTFVIDALA
jgi:transcription elongation GreA/GreB family factor